LGKDNPERNKWANIKMNQEIYKGKGKGKFRPRTGH